MKSRSNLVLMMWLVAMFTSIQSIASAQPHAVQVPTQIGEGEGQEVTVLLDDEHLKLATITLRAGTALPTHSAPVPATIQVVEGEGIIHVSGEPVPVQKGSIVVLAAGQEHDVVPAEESDMLVLVHYLRGTGKGGHDEAGGHQH